MTSFLFHPSLPQSLTSSFRPWFDGGLFRFVDIVDYRTLKVLPFETLRSNYKLPRECYYSYIQICSYMQRALSSTVVSLPTSFERLCKAGHSTKGLISDIYRILSDPSPETPPRHSYMDKWEQSLSCALSPATWQTIWRRAVKTSQCIAYRENQFKILMYWYHTPTFLHKLNPSIPDICWRCSANGGSQFHLFWGCPGIRPFWVVVQSLIFDVLGLRVPLDPMLFLLNVTNTTIPRFSMKMMLHILTAARCLIARFWRRLVPPGSIDLVARIKDVRTMEYMTALLDNKLDLFHKIWSLWDFYCAEHEV